MDMTDKQEQYRDQLADFLIQIANQIMCSSPDKRQASSEIGMMKNFVDRAISEFGYKCYTSNIPEHGCSIFDTY